MTANAPLTFTDEQLVAAVKASPQLLAQASVIAMEQELRDRREADDDE